MRKVVVKVELYDDKQKKKAMKAVTELDGLFSLAVDRIDKELTAIGEIEAADVVKKLKNICTPKLHIFETLAKEEKMKDEAPKKYNNKNTHKVELDVELPDYKLKKKAMRKVAELDGLDLVTVDTKGRKLTAIGDIDALKIEKKLKKICASAKILSFAPVGSANEKKKNDEKRKEDEKIKKSDAKGDRAIVINSSLFEKLKRNLSKSK